MITKLLLLILLTPIPSVGTKIFNDYIEAAAIDESITSADKISSFNFNYSKTGSDLGQENRISYNSTANMLTANTDEKPIYAIAVSEANESKLRDIFTYNEFFETSGNAPFGPGSIVYTLSVEMDGKVHAANWTNALPKVAPEPLMKIKDTVIDFVCKSSTNPIACETVMLEFR